MDTEEIRQIAGEIDPQTPHGAESTLVKVHLWQFNYLKVSLLEALDHIDAQAKEIEELKSIIKGQNEIIEEYEEEAVEDQQEQVNYGHSENSK